MTIIYYIKTTDKHAFTCVNHWYKQINTKTKPPQIDSNIFRERYKQPEIDR